MFIYNVTVKVNWQIHDAWLRWMQKEHMPELLATGCFKEYRLLRLLETDEEDGPTYTAQYYAESKTDYNRYIDTHAAGMRQKAINCWGSEFIAFRSLMQIVQ